MQAQRAPSGQSDLSVTPDIVITEEHHEDVQRRGHFYVSGSGAEDQETEVEDDGQSVDGLEFGGSKNRMAPQVPMSPHKTSTAESVASNASKWG